MPKRDELSIAVRFTNEQKAWLKAESERLDRPMAWVIRKAVDEMRDRRKRKSSNREDAQAP